MKKILIILAIMLVPSIAFATVTSTATNASFTCSGSVGPYPFTFPIIGPQSMVVYQNGTVLSTSAYTIAPVNGNYTNGGSVTLNSACTPNSTIVLLQRDTPITQLTQFTPYMPSLPASTEAGLDQLTEIDQELNADLAPLFTAQNPNVVLAGPASGSAAVPTFRALVSADIPNNAANTTGTAANVTGIVAVVNGGNGTSSPAIQAGSNVTVTGTWPSQTISVPGGASGCGVASPCPITSGGTGATTVGGAQQHLDIPPVCVGNSGSGSAYACTVSGFTFSFLTDVPIGFIPDEATVAGATLAVNGGSAVAISDASGSAIETGALTPGNLAWLWPRYNTFHLLTGWTISGPTQDTSFSYVCTNTSTDVTALNALLSPGNVALSVYPGSAGCAFSGTTPIVAVSGDSIDFNGAQLSAAITAATNVITNSAAVSPVTRSVTLTLTSGSQTATAGTAVFTSADQFNSLSCPAAYYSSYPLNVIITGVGGTGGSTTTIYMSAPSQVSSSISCTETTNDRNITIRNLNIVATATGSGYGPLPPLFFNHVSFMKMDNVNLTKIAAASLVGGPGTFWGPTIWSDYSTTVTNSSVIDTQTNAAYGSDGFVVGGPSLGDIFTNNRCIVNDACQWFISAANYLMESSLWQYAYMGSIDEETVTGLSGSGLEQAVALLEGCYDSACSVTAPINNITVQNTSSQPSVIFNGSNTVAPSGSSGFSGDISITGEPVTGNSFSHIHELNPQGKFGAYQVLISGTTAYGAGTTSLNLSDIQVANPLPTNSSSLPVIDCVSASSTYPTSVTGLTINAPYFQKTSSGGYLLSGDSHCNFTNLVTNDANSSDYSIAGTVTNNYTSGPIALHSNGDTSSSTLGTLGNATVAAVNGGSALASFTATTNGTAGSTHYIFEEACVAGNGTVTSPVYTLLTGNATMSATNSINIPTGSAIAGCPTILVYLTTTQGSFTKGLLCGGSSQPACPASGGTFVWAGVVGDGSTAPTASENTTGTVAVVGGSTTQNACIFLEQTAGTPSTELCYLPSGASPYGGFQAAQTLIWNVGGGAGGTYLAGLPIYMGNNGGGISALVDGSGNFGVGVNGTPATSDPFYVTPAGLVTGTASSTLEDPTYGSNIKEASSPCESSYGATTAHNGTTTITTGLSCLPANSVIDAVVYRITTTLSGNSISSFTVGISGSTSLFCGTQSTLTAGTTGTCFAQTGSSGAINSSAAAVVVTENQIATAGAIRLIVYYHTWTPPTS